MANYKIVDADQLDADLGSVADAIRAKRETTEALAFPNGFISAVQNISTGVTVQRATGTHNLIKVEQYYECGFKPDLVALICTDDDVEALFRYAAVAFKEYLEEFGPEPTNQGDISTFIATTSYNTFLHQEATGFRIRSSGNINIQVLYIAIKYTEDD